MCPQTFTESSLFALIDRVPGWLTRAEAYLLYRLARDERGPGRVVELGAWQGRSTICLALGLRSRPTSSSRMLSVDTHRGSSEHQPGGEAFARGAWDPVARRVDSLPAFRRNLEQHELQDCVEVFCGTTLEAAAAFRDRVRLLYIDADHEENAVRRDLQAWLPHLERSAVVVFHDFGTRVGPTRVVEALLRGGEFRAEWRRDQAIALRYSPPALQRTGAAGRCVGAEISRHWRLAVAGDMRARDAWRKEEGGRWSWTSGGVRVKGRRAQWAAYCWSSFESELRGRSRVEYRVMVDGKAEAAGLSFGPHRDFLAPLSVGKGPWQLRLTVEAAANRWAFRVNERLMPRQACSGHVSRSSDILEGTLGLKVLRPMDVSFEGLLISTT